MKKSILNGLVLLVMLTSLNACYAKSQVDNDVMKGIKLYKSGDYTACYAKMTKLVEKDPSNALAYYYLAMSASQIGKREEAIDCYDKVITLSSISSNIGRYANKGKVCLETPDACEDVSIDPTQGDGFITNKFGPKMSNEVKTQLENLKREELRRDINRDENIDIQRFKEFKDYSSMNNADIPTNDEIVSALRTLQRAGFGNMLNNNSDISMLTGFGQQNSMFNMMGGNSSLSPQVIQALLTNNMSQGF